MNKKNKIELSDHLHLVWTTICIHFNADDTFTPRKLKELGILRPLEACSKLTDIGLIVKIVTKSKFGIVLPVHIKYKIKEQR